MRKIAYLFIFIIVFSLTACTTESEPTQPVLSEPIETEYPIMTLEELSAFDGKDGAKAYIAVLGYVYDVTDSVYWPNGSHNGYQAGQDLTEPLQNLSPHGITNVQRFPIVAKLADGE